VITDLKPLELVLANGYNSGNGRVVMIEKKKKKDIYMEDSPVMTISGVTLADCPECSVRLRFHKPLNVGQLVVCPECDETLNVVSVRPLELRWADEDPWDIEDYDNQRTLARY
jgi:lysine biosynthesis protein LysW